MLVLNAGSSSIKFAVFDPGMAQVHSGIADEIGGASKLKLDGVSQAIDFPDQPMALARILGALEQIGVPLTRLKAAAHRVAHGGMDHPTHSRVTPDIEAQITRSIPLAPLHNPHNLAAIQTLGTLAPDLPQYACFDTVFHETMPRVATSYGVPEHITAMGIRRYGFHGLSYASLVRTLPDLTGAPLPSRILALHLGNGASLCAIRDGKSVGTTMGYSPLEGLTMGTRCGSIDPGAVLRLATELGPEATNTLLMKDSGLKGLSGGTSDMRTLLASDDPKAQFAVDHFCYWAARHAGSMLVSMGGVDAIAFTGGIGENAAPVRARIMEHLAWTGLTPAVACNDTAEACLHTPDSTVAAYIVPAQEEREIAHLTADLMQSEAA